VLTVWHYLLLYETLVLFRQYGIICFSIGLWNCSDSVKCYFYWTFGTVPTVWHHLLFNRTLELFRECGIIGFSFFYWTLELFRYCGIIYFSIGLWNCSDNMALFVFLCDHTVGTVPKSNRKINNSTLLEQFQSLIKTNNAILSEQFQSPI
jgi:uncharacterized membrane protein YiaA